MTTCMSLHTCPVTERRCHGDLAQHRVPEKERKELARWNKTWHSTSHHRITSLRTIKSELNISASSSPPLFHSAKRFSYWSSSRRQQKKYFDDCDIEVFCGWFSFFPCECESAVGHVFAPTLDLTDYAHEIVIKTWCPYIKLVSFALPLLARTAARNKMLLNYLKLISVRFTLLEKRKMTLATNYIASISRFCVSLTPNGAFRVSIKMKNTRRRRLAQGWKSTHEKISKQSVTD